MDLSCKLFIGNLPKDVTEGELLRLFTEYGDLQEIFIMGGERSRSGQSSAFVKYSNVESCEKAIAGVNMRGRVRPDDPDPVVVKFAKSASATGKRDRPEASPEPALIAESIISKPSSSTCMHPPLCKLFVGGLPSFVDRDDLIAIFAPFGHIDSVHLMQGKSKSGQACAFVTFQYPGPAQRAIDALSAKYTIDEDAPPISVRFADSEAASPASTAASLPPSTVAAGPAPAKRPRPTATTALGLAAALLTQQL
jgi:CUG-BP- and ETR3-like factor